MSSEKSQTNNDDEVKNDNDGSISPTSVVVPATTTTHPITLRKSSRKTGTSCKKNDDEEEHQVSESKVSSDDIETDYDEESSNLEHKMGKDDEVNSNDEGEEGGTSPPVEDSSTKKDDSSSENSNFGCCSLGAACRANEEELLDKYKCHHCSRQLHGIESGCSQPLGSIQSHENNEKQQQHVICMYQPCCMEAQQYFERLKTSKAKKEKLAREIESMIHKQQQRKEERVINIRQLETSKATKVREFAALNKGMEAAKLAQSPEFNKLKEQLQQKDGDDGDNNDDDKEEESERRHCEGGGGKISFEQNPAVQPAIVSPETIQRQVVLHDDDDEDERWQKQQSSPSATTPEEEEEEEESATTSPNTGSNKFTMIPLAKEGNWEAFLDEETTGQIYYFNTITGESLWEPPTLTFPDITLPPQKQLLANKIQNNYRNSRRREAQLQQQNKQKQQKKIIAKPTAIPTADTEKKSSSSARDEATRLTKHRMNVIFGDYIDYSYLPDDAAGPDPNRTTTTTGSGGGRAAAKPFQTKLYEMLENEDPNIICWQPHGRAFNVLETKEFATEVLPKYFKQTKWTSFQRQCNLYGFSRIGHGPDKGAYYHELFLRGRKKLSNRIVRKKLQGNPVRGNQGHKVDFYAMPFVNDPNTSSSSSRKRHRGKDTTYEDPNPRSSPWDRNGSAAALTNDKAANALARAKLVIDSNTPIFSKRSSMSSTCGSRCTASSSSYERPPPPPPQSPLVPHAAVTTTTRKEELAAANPHIHYYKAIEAEKQSYPELEAILRPLVQVYSMSTCATPQDMYW